MNRKLFSFIAAAAFVGIAAVVFASPVEAKKGDVSTWLGTLKTGDGSNANNAYLDNPEGFAVDPSGTIYIADTLNNSIRKLTTGGVISTVAGSGQYGLKNGTATSAEFKSPSDVEYASDGALYVTDTGNGVIRVVRNGSVTSWVTMLKSPTGTYLDGTTLYISDTGRNRILKATYPSGRTTVVANITKPGKLTMLDGYLYAAHADSTTLSKIDPTTGLVSNAVTGVTDLDGLTAYQHKIYYITSDRGMYNEVWTYDPATGTTAMLVHVVEDEWYNHASDIQFYGDSMYLLFSSGSSVYKLNADATNPVKIAGAHRYGDKDGKQGSVALGRPKAMVYSKDKKKIYILENHRFKVFDIATKTLSFVAGSPMDNWRDATGSNARVSGPTQMVLSKDGTKIYFADRNNNRIRALVIAEARLETLTGAGSINQFSNERNGYAEGAACTTEFTQSGSGCAYFERPMGIALSKSGNLLYIADTGNNRIRAVNVATGATTLIAGSSAAGLKDGVGAAAKFNSPISLTLSSDGMRLYVVDQKNHAIREIALATRRVKTLVGTGKGGYREGSFSVARLNLPDSLALGPNNTLYLSEVGTQRIRIIDLKKKTVSLLAGSGQRGARNGTAKVASFYNPRGMLVFNSNYLLVADQMNDLIRAVKLR
jgi:DNA-binding beta-propeller fold protein YncE